MYSRTKCIFTHAKVGAEGGNIMSGNTGKVLILTGKQIMRLPLHLCTWQRQMNVKNHDVSLN